MVGQLIYLQDSLLEGTFLLSIAPEFIRGYLSHKIETHLFKLTMHEITFYISVNAEAFADHCHAGGRMLSRLTDQGFC